MKRLVSLLSPVVVLVGLVGCGGSQPASSDTADWVNDVCGRMTALDHELAAERADLDAAVTAASDAPTILTAVDHYLGELSSFVSLAAGDIDRLGVPTLDGDSSSRLHHDIDLLFKRTDAQTGELTAKVKGALAAADTATEQAVELRGEAVSISTVDEEMRLILDDYRQVRLAFDDASSCERWVDQLAGTSTTTPVTTTTPPTTVVPTTLPATTVEPTTVPPTTVPATTVPPTTVPVTVDPYIAVRDMYMAAAAEYNPKFDAVWTAFHDADDYILYKDMPTYCEQSATLEREWYDRMSGIPWPPDAVDEAQAHAAEAQVRISLLDQCAAAPATRAGQDALLTALNSEYDSYFMAVDALRVAIGLPSLGG